METNKNNQIILNEHDVVSAWLKDIDIDSAVFKDVEPINIYNQWCDKYDSDGKIVTQAEDTSAEYTENCVSKWHMPDEYKNQCAVTAYKDYYWKDKRVNIDVKWDKKRSQPEWWMNLQKMSS